MSKWHGGKGSKPRPITDRKQFEDNWDAIFKNKAIEEVTAPSTIIPPHPNQAVYREYTQPWLELSDDERAWAILADAEVYKRYCLAQKYGPQLYNYVTQGMTL